MVACLNLTWSHRKVKVYVVEISALFCMINGNSNIQHGWLFLHSDDLCFIGNIFTAACSMMGTNTNPLGTVVFGFFFALQLPRSKKLMFTRKIFFFSIWLWKMYREESACLFGCKWQCSGEECWEKSMITGRSHWSGPVTDAPDPRGMIHCSLVYFNVVQQLPSWSLVHTVNFRVVHYNYLSDLHVLHTALSDIQTYRHYQVSKVFSSRAFRVQISDIGLLNQLIICVETNPLHLYMQDCYKIEDQMPGV